MQYIIVDLEATCDRTGFALDRMETIEIGAVRLASAEGPVGEEFQTFIRPVATQQLTTFCKELTGIRQEDVDDAPYFYDAFPRFLKWIGDEPFVLCSWGAYDRNQFAKDCDRHKMAFPESFASHLNLKTTFAVQNNTRPMGMVGALSYLKIPHAGSHHRGIDDARNIAQIALRVLPKWEQESIAKA